MIIKTAMSLAAMVVVLGLLAGCDKSDPVKAKPAEVKPAAATVKADCPLCVGHQITVTDKTPRAEHAGKVYYFCSDDCKQEFVKNPAAHIKAPATQPASVGMKIDTH